MALKYEQEREKSLHLKISLKGNSFELGSVRSKTIEERSNYLKFIELCVNAETEFGKVESGNYRCIAPFIKPKPIRNLRATTKDYDKYIDSKDERTLKELVKHWYFVGKGYRKLNCYEQAIVNCNFGLEAISVSELSIPDYETLLHVAKAKTFSNKGDLEKSFNSLKSASESIKRLSKKDERRKRVEGELYLVKAGAFNALYEHKPDRKILLEWQSSAKKADECFSKLNYERKRGYAEWEQLRMFRALGKFDEVAKLKDQIEEERANIVKPEEEKWSWCVWLKFDDSELARLNGDYTLAKKLCVESLKESKELGNLNRMSNAFINLSNIERELEHPNRAYLYLLWAKMIPSKVTDSAWRDGTISRLKKEIKERSTEYLPIIFL